MLSRSSGVLTLPSGQSSGCFAICIPGLVYQSALEDIAVSASRDTLGHQATLLEINTPRYVNQKSRVVYDCLEVEIKTSGSYDVYTIR